MLSCVTAVVTVVDVDDEDRVGNSLLQIWELRFGHKAKKIQILSKRFGQDFEFEVQARFLSWNLVSRTQPLGPLCLV